MELDRGRSWRGGDAGDGWRRLCRHLCDLAGREWRTSFGEVEAIIGFELPAEARLHRDWWSTPLGGSDSSEAPRWGAAGWEVAWVDLDSETLVFHREASPGAGALMLEELLPVHSAGAWPEGSSLRREHMYSGRGA